MIGDLVTIEEHITTLKGFAFKSAWYTETGLPIVKVSDFTQDSVSPEKVAYIPIESSSDFEKYKLEKGDVLIQTVGSWEHNPNSVVGKVVRIPEVLNDSLLNQNIVKIIPKETLDKSFLFYLLKNDAFKGYIIKTAQGAANQASITLESIKAFKFIYKDKTTQSKIAKILSAYDDLIENNLKRIKLLEEKAFLRYKLMQKDLQDAQKINLYDIANIQMGFAFKAEAFNEEGEGIPIIRIRDIPGQLTKSFTTQEVDSQYWVEKGDLLIGMDGEFHMNEWLGQRGYLVQRVCRLRAKNELYQSYLWQALKEPIHYYETTISGATVAHLGKKHLEEIFIAKPKDSMKVELGELNTMRKLKIVLAQQNIKLREARDILLPKLMNGQIEV
jgi:type I restriction enzyme S subunit